MFKRLIDYLKKHKDRILKARDREKEVAEIEKILADKLDRENGKKDWR